MFKNSPTTINPLSNSGYRLFVDRLPECTYWWQQVPIPGIALGQPKVATPLVDWPIPGDKILFEPLELQFLVDENLENYIAIFRWIRDLGFPDDNLQYTSLMNRNRRFKTDTELSTNFSDATMHILDSNNNTVQKIIFKDMFPFNLRINPNFTSTNIGVNYVGAQVTFAYTSFTFDGFEDIN